MPITPLHMAAGGMSFNPKWVIPFAVTQVIIDFPTAMVMFFDWPMPLHGTTHTLLFAALLSVLAMWTKYWKPVAVGAIGHVLLDAIVHADIQLLYPLTEVNPLFIAGSIEYVSYLCLVAIGIQLLLLFICHIPWGTLSE